MSSLRQLYRICKTYKPDIVFSSTVKANIYGGIVCKLLNIPIIINVSGLGTVFLYNHLHYKYIRIAYYVVCRFARHVFFENDDDRCLFMKNRIMNNISSSILPGSGVDIKRFTYSEPSIVGRQFTFLLVARIIGDKGVREYVEAAAIVKKSGRDARFILLGSIGQNNNIGDSNISAIERTELDLWQQAGIVEWFDHQDEILSFYCNCDILVLPSYREGLPKTVLEAAAVGRPALVTDVPGCRQSVLAGQTGWLCKPRDAHDLARVMMDCYDMPYDQLKSIGLAARRRVVEEFSEQRVIDAYLKFVS